MNTTCFDAMLGHGVAGCSIGFVTVLQGIRFVASIDNHESLSFFNSQNYTSVERERFEANTYFACKRTMSSSGLTVS
jgi:hypothetical protein